MRMKSIRLLQQINHGHYTYDANGNPVLVADTSPALRGGCTRKRTTNLVVLLDVLSNNFNGCKVKIGQLWLCGMYEYR
ncbi:MAG: hypothetical protein ACFN4V_06490, partial [Prevotella denticola]